MAEITLQQAVEIGLEHHRRGQFREAELIYQQILKHDPRNADALHLLGVLAHQGKRSDYAVELISRAIVVNPEMPMFHYNLAEAFNALGKKDDAVASYRRAMELAPDYFEPHNNLANLLVELNRPLEAEELCRRAMEIDPESPSPYNNLGNALRKQNRLLEAMLQYEKALSLRPDFPEALNNLGIAMSSLGRTEEAVTTYRKAIATRPLFGDALNNLGNALVRLGRVDEAIEAFEAAVRVMPQSAPAHNNLAAALKGRSLMDRALEHYRKAIELRPDFAEAHNNLAAALRDVGKMEEAAAEARKAIELRADFAEAYCNLGLVMRQQARTDDAVEAFEQATHFAPASAEAHCCLGFGYLEQGRLDEAIASTRRSLELACDPQAHSNLLLALNYNPRFTPQQVFEEHRRFGELYEKHWCASIPEHSNDRNPTRRLRIGYVSPDFRGHAVSFFILPVLQNHEMESFEIFCYSNHEQRDATTLTARTLADRWRDIKGLTPQKAAQVIRDDQIDILIDLAGHTANNSLPLFTCKPAPIQMSWIGYPNTTGLTTIDYRVSDPYCDPVGKTEHLNTERLIRLPASVWCYAPPLPAQRELGPLPADTKGYVTFGSVNNFAKVTPQVLGAWADILRRVPRSRLVMQSSPLGFPYAQNYVREFFARAGVEPDRLTLSGWMPLEEYFQTITGMDIALDPFPFNGGTTSCHSVWMGLPMVALEGRNHVSRMGVSTLNNIGLAELVAPSVDGYVQTACALAEDIGRLRDLRASMRDRMRASPLMNAELFTRQVESAFRDAWSAYCHG